MQKAHTNTWKLIERFQQSQMLPKLSHGAFFTMCLHTFTFFWSRKTSVIVKTFQLGFRVFVCAFHPEISSFFSVRVSSFFSCFLCYPYFSTFFSTLCIIYIWYVCSILHNCHKVFFKQMSSWLLFGQLIDRYAEFFIQPLTDLLDGQVQSTSTSESFTSQDANCFMSLVSMCLSTSIEHGK